MTQNVLYQTIEHNVEGLSQLLSLHLMESLYNRFTSVGSGIAVTTCHGSRMSSAILLDLNSSLDSFESFDTLNIDDFQWIISSVLQRFCCMEAKDGHNDVCRLLNAFVVEC